MRQFTSTLIAMKCRVEKDVREPPRPVSTLIYQTGLELLLPALQPFVDHSRTE